MKKRILVFSRWLEIGGAERALLGLLYSIDYSKYSVDLYLTRHSGELMPFIPKDVNLLPEDKSAATIAIPMIETIKQGHFCIAVGRLIGKLFTRFDRNAKVLYSNIAIDNSNRYTYRFIHNINPSVTYDLAISFLAPHYIVANKVKAKKKIAWVHCDYGAIHINRENELKVWEKFDYVANVSAECLERFSKVFPELSSKAIVLENINNTELIRKLAIEFDVSCEMDASIKILTIGRYDPTRNFEKIPYMCDRLLKNGISVKWYIIGFGNSNIEQSIIKNAEDLGVSDNVVLLGKKSNPYPYIKKCDLYVMPSSDEGKSVAVIEAQIIGKPVVITNYPTASSQLKDDYDGIIAPMDFDKCADVIYDLIMHQEKRNKLSMNCLNSDYSNSDEVKKIYGIIEE